MIRRVAIPLLVVAAIGAGLSLLWRSGRSGSPPDPAVATVNGTVIGLKALDVRVASLLPMASFHGNIPPDRLASLRRAALDELILEEMVWQDASRRGLRAEEAAVEAELSNVRGRFGSEAEFRSALDEDGVRLADYRRYLARRVLVRQERRQQSAPPAPTEAEVAGYYASNAAQFVRPEQVRLLEILVKVDPVGTPEDERAAGERTDAVLARLRRGEPFEAVARDASDDAFAVEGGDLGWVHRGRLDRDLEQAVFAAPVGELRRARSILGFHVFKVTGREIATQLAFEEARPLIVDRLGRARQEAMRQAWEAGLRASTEIDILDPVLRDAAPMTLPAFERAPLSGGLSPMAAHTSR